MTKVFIIHGFEGHPNGGWRPWLMGELEKKNIYCASLVMKDPDHPKLKDWMDEIRLSCKKFPKDDFILIGHSLGVPAILKYLQKYKPKSIKGLVLVSGIYKDDVIDKHSKFLKPFFGKFEWEKLKKNYQNIFIIHGDNDKSVGYHQAEFMKEKLGAELICVKNGGHLNGSAGFFILPEALKAIGKILK